MAAKKKASAKKRTPAQRRATAKLVAMNKKKRASKKKPAVRRTARRTNPVRPLRSRAKKKATSRKRNPVVKRYVVCVTDWPSPGYKNYVSSIAWKNGVWIVDNKKTNAIRGTKPNMQNIGESVIEQLRERMPNFNPFKNVYLEEA